MDISPMTLAELDMVLDWAAVEGWNPGIDDAAAFWSADPEGFLLMRVSGVPAAAISVVNHDPSFAFLGLYLCRPEFRGKGYGLAVWQAGIAHAGGRTIGLEGVPAQQANYEASGFVRAGKTTRYTGRMIGRMDGLRPMVAEDLPHLLALDKSFTGVTRDRYLSAWLRGAKTRHTWVLGPVGAPVAIATHRKCREGGKIGPLWAVALDDALQLVGACSNGHVVSIDVPDACSELGTALQQAGFLTNFETARMYRGDPPSHAPASFSGVTTLELG